MIMANSATVPAVLPAHASHEAVAWWHRSVTTILARTPDRRDGATGSSGGGALRTLGSGSV
jgi:hypothetical protein